MLDRVKHTADNDVKNDGREKMIPLEIVGMTVVLGIMSFSALILCPHSKVEESFNLQATRDLYVHGISSSSKEYYDHLQYPGVVPRTFLGPIVLSTILQVCNFVITKILMKDELDPWLLQYMARGILLSFVIHSHYRLACSVHHRFSYYNDKYKHVGMAYLAITSCQFHLVFYGSRMLPNIFALVLILHAYAEWFSSVPVGTSGKSHDWHPSMTAALLVASTSIFRCDVLILLFTLGLSLLIRNQLTIKKAILVGIVTGSLSLIITVPLDTFLWNYKNDNHSKNTLPFLWPEGQVLFFNTIENKSSDYGVSPWYWYFTSAIPKAMLGTLFFIPFGIFPLNNYDTTTCFMMRIHILPVLGFVTLYSFLPHKEVRFIFPALPIFNIVAANGICNLIIPHPSLPPNNKDVEDENKPVDHQRSKMSLMPMLQMVIVVGLLAGSLLGSCIFVAVSRQNYPGGQALKQLSEQICARNNDSSIQKNMHEEDLHVFIDVASAMTGISLFGQDAAQTLCLKHGKNVIWKFTKAGYENAHDLRSISKGNNNMNDYTHILSEDSSLGLPSYEMIGVAQGYPHLNIRKFRVDLQNAIHIYQHKNYV